MRERLYYLFTSKAFIIIASIIGALAVTGVGVLVGFKIFKEDEPKMYYQISLIFVDENGDFVEGVEIRNGDILLFTTNTNGTYNDKYVESGTILSFKKEGYQILTQSFVVEKNTYTHQIDLISNDSFRLKSFTIKVVDINGLPIKKVRLYEGNTLLGTNDNNGEYKIPLLEGNKQLSFRAVGAYFSFPSLVINYDDAELTKVIKADFLLDKYLNYVNSKGEPQTRNFTVGYDFLTPDGRRLGNTKINYKLKDKITFLVGVGYNIVFENQVFESAFAYVYDEVNAVWLCSPILKTSPIGGNIYLNEGVHISSKVDSPRGTIFTSSGYYFLADNDMNIEIVLPKYEGERFYKELEYKIPKYEQILVNNNNEPILFVEKSISNVKFINKK